MGWGGRQGCPQQSLMANDLFLLWEAGQTLWHYSTYGGLFLEDGHIWGSVGVCMAVHGLPRV